MKEKMLKKLKSVKFWLSLSGAVVIVLQLFGLKISAPYVNEVVSAICSVFVILGIMVPDNRDDLPGKENEHDNQGDADGAGDEAKPPRRRLRRINAGRKIFEKKLENF